MESRKKLLVPRSQRKIREEKRKTDGSGAQEKKKIREAPLRAGKREK